MTEVDVTEMLVDVVRPFMGQKASRDNLEKIRCMLIDVLLRVGMSFDHAASMSVRTDAGGRLAIFCGECLMSLEALAELAMQDRAR